ncbi:VOC family protein [Paraburkholderia sp. J67]|uniref:VOC family protein n=1 Tax=Paraburkholderia sp. J67 TaxID=2805435 RepID=UPI002ABD32A9|nr:VOC family protein [Paraburkholderia sp. J67]
MVEVDMQSVYIVAKDMDRLSEFYRSALNLPMQFRDASRWTQFRLQRSAFALSSVEEAAQGATGAVPVFQIAGEHRDDMEQKILAAGGQLIGKRDMGSHGSVSTYQDPEDNLFQVFSKAPAREA